MVLYNSRLIIEWAIKVYGTRLTIKWITYGPVYDSPGTIYGPDYGGPGNPKTLNHREF